MSTADKLTYLNDTKDLIKDSINLGGGNLTTEPFRQYATTLKNIYKDFLANGIGTLWNNWEKVTGTGTSLNLSPTIQGEMEFTYKGNTSQNGTPTPTSPIPINVVSGDNTIDICGKNWFELNNFQNNSTGRTSFVVNDNDIVMTAITGGTYRYIYKQIDNLTIGQPYTIKIGNHNDTSTNKLAQWGITTTGGKYYNSVQTLSNTQTLTITPTETSIQFRVGYLTNSCSANDTLTTGNIQLEKGNQATTYEPYIGASHDIYLGVENLFNYNLFNDFTTGNQTLTLTLKPNTTYTMSSNIPAYSVDSSANLFAYNSTSSPSTNTNGIKPGVPRQITTNADGIIKITYRNLGDELIAPKTTYWYQIELGSKANHYTPFGQTPIELCKIGTYEDYIRKSTGINLFDKSKVTTGVLDADGTISSGNLYITDFIEVKPNTNYITNELVGSHRGKYYNASKEAITNDFDFNLNNNTKILTTNEAKYVRFAFTSTLVDTLQFQEGSIALPYEPYGKVWYLHKEIGKYVYDNDLGENGISGNVVSLLTPEVNIQANISDDGLYENAYCNLLPAKRINGTGLKGTTSSKRIRIETKGYGNDYATIRALLVGLIIYFPLEIPTNTPITDTTLINQLEESKLSYISQTNISQVNNDLPFILVVKALKNI